MGYKHCLYSSNDAGPIRGFFEAFIRPYFIFFEERLDGFKGGLSAQNYSRIAKTSASTATRDLSDLVKNNAPVQTGELKYTRYFLKLREK